MGDPNAFKNITSPWMPPTDPIELAILGKLQEELGELSGIIGRIQCQGITGSEPVTKVPNAEALENEIADVCAGMEKAIVFYGLMRERMALREADKLAHLERWHRLIRETLS